MKKDIIRYIEKEKQKLYLDLFMIITQLAKKENIISFTYKDKYLTVQTGVNDYYRIYLEDKEVLDD